MTDAVDLVALDSWLAAQGLLRGDGPLEVTPLGEGHSNLTFAVRRGSAELVLRRPPRGPLLPTAHDVVREARVMSCCAPPTTRSACRRWPGCARTPT